MLLTMKVLRIQNKWTQEYVAYKLGVSQPMVSYLESGSVTCSDEQKATLKELFKVGNANDLFIPYDEYLRR